MAPVVFALLTILGLGADVSARKMLEELPAPKTKESPESMIQSLTLGRLLVNIPGETPDAGIQDEYLPFFKKDYIPKDDGSQLLELKDIAGKKGSGLVEDLVACAALCSGLDGCNAASFYIEGSELPGKKNCWLKTADFKASSLSSCELPSDATDDEDAVLLFLVDDTCVEKEVPSTLPGDGTTPDGTGASNSAPAPTPQASAPAPAPQASAPAPKASAPAPKASAPAPKASAPAPAPASTVSGRDTGIQAASQNVPEQGAVTPPVSGAMSMSSAGALAVVLGGLAMLI